MARIAEPVITLTSGPVDAYPAVLRALSRTVWYDYDPAFQQFYEQVALKAQKALRSPGVPVILHGEPVLGLEAALSGSETPERPLPPAGRAGPGAARSGPSDGR